MPQQRSEERRLLVFFGKVAAGKSLLAREWAERHGCAYYNTDVVRKELAGLAADQKQHAAVGEGIYSAQASRRTYEEMIRRGIEQIDGETTPCVVLDGSFGEEKRRRDVVAAFASRCPVSFIYCFCSEEAVRERLELRRRDPHAVSDGRWEIYQLQNRQFDVPETLAGASLLQLNTEQPLELLIASVASFIGMPPG